MSRIDYFDEASARHDLGRRAARGGVDTAAAQSLLFLLQMASIPILSRLLDREDFGLVSLVLVFTGFGRLFIDAGLSMATIQQATISRQQASNLFWLSVALGVSLAAATAAAAPLVAYAYDDPRLTPLMIALATPYIFGAIGLQPQALLQRTLQLRRLAVVSVVSAIVGHAVAIAIALQWPSAWALVAREVIASGVTTALLFATAGWMPNLPRRQAGTKSLVTFGANTTGFNLLNYLSRNLDRSLIGWWSGAASLGVYDRAYRLTVYPLSQFNTPISSVMLPTLSRLQDAPQRYREAYLHVVRLSQLVVGCALAVGAVSAKDVTLTALGPEFADAAPIFSWLCVAMLSHPLCVSTGWLFISQGRDRDLRNWGLVSAPLIVFSFLVGAPFGPVAVAASYAICMNLIILPMLFYRVGAKGPVTAYNLWGVVLGAAIPIAVAAGLAATLSAVLPGQPAWLKTIGAFSVVLAVIAGTLVGGREARKSLDFCLHNLSRGRKPFPDNANPLSTPS